MRIGAIEAGGTKFVLAIGDEKGEIERRQEVPTEEPEKTMAKVKEFFIGENLDAMGVGSFGPIDLDKDSPTYGSITSTPKVKWQNYNLIDELKTYIDAPIGFDTDVNGAALGEAFFGSCRGLDSCLYMTIGTGIGAGAMESWKLIHGMLHPEMGHIILRKHKDDDFKGVCPFHGDCFEGLAAGPALEARTGMKGRDIPDDHKVFDILAYYVAQALVNYILILSPKRIVVGGGVMHRGHVLGMVRRYVRELLGGYLRTPELEDLDSYIVYPELGNDAGIKGAIALGLSALEDDQRKK
ncbi:ROK family protein [Youngiibacter multivorans]|uniref:fructokinase n=1 Tax=Youngiibacter multivorans TaxID=937251 RepID=A0ABS4G5H9_9CLOT|nr:ROK family protein [Youngiibacter multivorans]MBP1919793.1 fructokinase [Youngiibacter multivorans]